MISPLLPTFGLFGSLFMRSRTRVGLLLAVLLCRACVTLPDYQRPDLAVASSWSTDAPGGPDSVPGRAWWTLLEDPAVDRLVDATLAGNPSLIESIARVDEARASLGIERSARLPAINVNATAGRGSQRVSSVDDASVALASSASAGLSLSWELDLFGRVRSSVESARRRLDARDAEAQGVRLKLTAEVATTVLGLRACQYALAIQREEVASRETVLQLTRGSVRAGSVARSEEARAQSALGLSRTTTAALKESCDRQVNAASALSGQSPAQVRELISAAPASWSASQTLHMATPPETRLALPATVLLRHPSVVAAERELAAAWSDVGAANAARLPRLDLGAALTGQWLRLGGLTFDYTTRLLSVGAAASLFDGGRGKAAVGAAEARYRAAAARLALAVQGGWRDVEDALAAIDSSRLRLASSSASVDASRRLLGAAEAQWRAGSISLFELEDARRLFSQSRSNEIAAARDRGQAWVALIRASGSVDTLAEHP